MMVNTRFVVGAIYPLVGALIVLALWPLSLGVSSMPEQLSNLGSGESAITGHAPFNLSSVEHIFVFGDSYSDTWFDPEGPQPSSEDPFGNQLRPSLVEHYKVATWIKHFHHGLFPSNPKVFNFAFGGGKVEANVLEPWPQELPPSKDCTALRGQVRCWASRYAVPPWTDARAVKFWKPETSLFVLWSGINDAFEGTMNGDKFPAPDALFGSYTASLENLYRHGARHVVIMNLPPLQHAGAIPFVNPIKPFVQYFNDRLLAIRDKLKSRRPDARYYLFDTYGLLDAAAQDPTSFTETEMIKEVHKVCQQYGGTDDNVIKLEECQHERNQYFWLADLHIGPSAHKLVAARVRQDCFQMENPSAYCS